MKSSEMIAIAAIAVVVILVFYFITAKGPVRKITIINGTNNSNTTGVSNTTDKTNISGSANNTNKINPVSANKTNTTNSTVSAEDDGKISITNPGDSGVEISVEIADNSVTRAKGLMGRASLGEYDGMLFVFGSSARHSFWMFNTSIALDAVFIAENGTVVDILQMAPCGINPANCTGYMPKADAKYVLEVNRGFSERHGIVINKSWLVLDSLKTGN